MPRPLNHFNVARQSNDVLQGVSSITPAEGFKSRAYNPTSFRKEAEISIER